MLYINLYYYIYYNIYNNINITFFFSVTFANQKSKWYNGTMVHFVCVNYAVTYQCTIVPFNKLEILFVNA